MRKGSPIVLLAVLVACGSCVPGRTPSPSPSQPVAVATGAGPPDAAPSAATCNAGPNYCCERDGTILPVVCSPRPRGNETQRSRGPGGWCQGCYRRCLPPSARIATPGGERAVASLRVGELVWSVDAAGARVAAPIALVRSIPAPTEHRVLRIALADGRVVAGSAGHPSADGRPLSAFEVGEQLDGARVVMVDSIPLDGDATWDLLPAGTTGLYWADGVLLGSTIVPGRTGEAAAW